MKWTSIVNDTLGERQRHEHFFTHWNFIFVTDFLDDLYFSGKVPFIQIGPFIVSELDPILAVACAKVSPLVPL